MGFTGSDARLLGSSSNCKLYRTGNKWDLKNAQMQLKERYCTLGMIVSLSMELEDGSDKDRSLESCWKRQQIHKTTSEHSCVHLCGIGAANLYVVCLVTKPGLQKDMAKSCDAMWTHLYCEKGLRCFRMKGFGNNLARGEKNDLVIKIFLFSPTLHFAFLPGEQTGVAVAKLTGN